MRKVIRCSLILLSVTIMLNLSLIPAFAAVSNIFVFNSGDQTLSIIKCINSSKKMKISCVEKERVQIGFSSSWPANQYPGHPAWWWTGLSGEVVGLKARSTASPLQEEGNILFVDTYDIPGRPDSGANFISVVPGGLTAWNAAREVDRLQEIDTDPDSPTFGTILTEIVVPDNDPSSPETDTRGAVRPNNTTVTPDGKYLISVELAGESMTVVDIDAKEIIHQVTPPPADPGIKVLPFRATTNGNIVIVGNLEFDNTIDVWDISELPSQPLHLKKLTQADGLGISAQDSEFTPDGRYAYLIINGSPIEEGRIDVLDMTSLDIVDPIELPENCRPHTGDFSNDGSYFFVNCSGSDKVAVIDNDLREVVQEIQVGSNPRGLIVR